MLLRFKNDFEDFNLEICKNFNLKICKYFDFEREYNILQIKYLDNNKVLSRI